MPLGGIFVIFWKQNGRYSQNEAWFYLCFIVKIIVLSQKTNLQKEIFVSVYSIASSQEYISKLPTGGAVMFLFFGCCRCF